VRGQEATPSRPTILFNGASPGLFLGFIARGRAAGNYENLTGSLATKDPPRCNLSPSPCLKERKKKKKRFTPLVTIAARREAITESRERLLASTQYIDADSESRNVYKQDSRSVRAFLAHPPERAFLAKRARLNSTTRLKKMENDPSRFSNFARMINNMTQWRDILPNKKSRRVARCRADSRRRRKYFDGEKGRERDREAKERER